jgi:hypothetical protein
MELICAMIGLAHSPWPRLRIVAILLGMAGLLRQLAAVNGPLAAATVPVVRAV